MMIDLDCYMMIHVVVVVIKVQVLDLDHKVHKNYPNYMTTFVVVVDNFLNI